MFSFPILPIIAFNTLRINHYNFMPFFFFKACLNFYFKLDYDLEDKNCLKFQSSTHIELQRIDVFFF